MAAAIFGGYYYYTKYYLPSQCGFACKADADCAKAGKCSSCQSGVCATPPTTQPSPGGTNGGTPTPAPGGGTQPTPAPGGGTPATLYYTCMQDGICQQDPNGTLTYTDCLASCVAASPTVGPTSNYPTSCTSAQPSSTIYRIATAGIASPAYLVNFNTGISQQLASAAQWQAKGVTGNLLQDTTALSAVPWDGTTSSDSTQWYQCFGIAFMNPITGATTPALTQLPATASLIVYENGGVDQSATNMVGYWSQCLTLEPPLSTAVQLTGSTLTAMAGLQQACSSDADCPSGGGCAYGGCLVQVDVSDPCTSLGGACGRWNNSSTTDDSHYYRCPSGMNAIDGVRNACTEQPSGSYCAYSGVCASSSCSGYLLGTQMGTCA